MAQKPMQPWMPFWLNMAAPPRSSLVPSAKKAAEGPIDRAAYFGPHALHQQRMFTTPVC